MTSATAPCKTPPSEVKSFWYSIRTTAVDFGSTDIARSYSPDTVNGQLDANPGSDLKQGRHRRRRVVALNPSDARSERLVNRPHRARALPHRGSYSLHRPRSHVSRGKNGGHACL